MFPVKATRLSLVAIIECIGNYRMYFGSLSLGVASAQPLLSPSFVEFKEQMLSFSGTAVIDNWIAALTYYYR